MALVGCSLQNFDSLGNGAGGLAAGGGAGVGGTTDMGATGGAGGIPSLGAGGSGRGGVGGTAANQPEAGVDPSGGTGGGLPPLGAGGTSAGDGGAGMRVNLLADPSFEAGHADWFGFGQSTISDASNRAHTGTHSIVSTDRTATWQGPARNIEPLVTPGALYEVSAWAWTAAPTLSLSLKQWCADETATYSPLATDLAASTWVYLQGQFVAPSCSLTELSVYVEGPAAGEEFYVDDVGLTLVP